MEQAIRTAIEFETKVRDVYRQAATDCADQRGQRVFAVLADEEQHHLDFLQAKLVEWKRDGKVDPAGLRRTLPPRVKIEAGVMKLKKPLEKKECPDEIDLTERALQVESQTSEFYKRVVGELPPGQRALFEPFIEIEDGHLALVQAELDALRGLGFYFDHQEFDFEAG